MTRIHELLLGRGCPASYSSLRRFILKIPGGPRIFQAPTNSSEPLRLPDPVEHVQGLGFSDFTIPMAAGPVYRFLAAPTFHRGVRAGHVFVGNREGGEEFTLGDQQTLAMFASQAARVIANAHTHREGPRARADPGTLVNTSSMGVEFKVLDTVVGRRQGRPRCGGSTAPRSPCAAVNSGLATGGCRFGACRTRPFKVDPHRQVDREHALARGFKKPQPRHLPVCPV